MTRIFKEFDADGSNSLEVEEFALMLLVSFICPNKKEWHKLPEGPAKEVVEKSLSKLEEELKVLYSLVTDGDSLTLEQFVSLCLHPQANTLLSQALDPIRKIRQTLSPETIALLGFAPHLPDNFESMVMTLVYQTNVAELRSKLTAEMNAQKKMKILEEIYELGKGMQEYSVNKYQVIYELNKRNITGSTDPLANHRSEEREKFYAELFQKQKEELDNSSNSVIDFKPLSKTSATSQRKSAYLPLQIQEPTFESEEFKPIRCKIDKKLRLQILDATKSAKEHIEKLASRGRPHSWRMLSSRADSQPSIEYSHRKPLDSGSRTTTLRKQSYLF